MQPAAITHASDRLGWTLGGGVEAMLWSNWFVRGEYRYSDFGTIGNDDVRSNARGSALDAYDLHVKTHTATLGVGYRFGGDKDPMAAQAAVPLPSAATPSWSGPYLGLGGGFRSTLTDAKVVSTNFDCFRPGGCVRDQPLNDTAGRISPYAGWNWQFAPQWVAGIEGDFGFADKTTTLNGMYYPQTQAGVFGNPPDQFSVKTGWDASARARLGFVAFPNTLLYATGGASWLQVETQSTCSTNPLVGQCGPVDGLSPSVIRRETTKLGWTVGGGFEAIIWRNWLARAEYRYADFGTISNTDTRADISIPEFGEVISYDTHIRTHTLTFGLAYKFDWGDPVAAKF